MSKKIMILCASPNKEGNTRTVVEWVRHEAEVRGADVEVIDLASLKYKVNGCIACMGCQKSDKYECVIEDEATPVLARIPDNDVLIFATPLYFFGPSAQLKLTLDRMYSLFKFNRDTGEIRHHLKHMTFGLISTAGSNEFGSLEQMFNAISKFAGVKFKSLLIQFTGESGEIKEDTRAKEKAIAFANIIS